MLKICLFGDSQITGEIGEVTFPTQQGHALLFYLSLANGASVSRDDVALALWPGKPLDSAKTNLRTTLYQIRSTLGDANPLVAPLPFAEFEIGGK